MRAFLAAHPRVPRDALTFTTKLRANAGYAATRAAIAASAAAARTRPDLYLLHAPHGGARARRECWRAVEDALAAGEVRAAGVSNFGVRHLAQLLAAPDLRARPTVNQIELHVFNAQAPIVAFCRAERIVLQAYAPLAKGTRMRDPTLVAVAARCGATVSQVMLRWGIQNGFVVLPKSANEERIRENAALDFEISDEDMALLAQLDEGLCTGETILHRNWSRLTE